MYKDRQLHADIHSENDYFCIQKLFTYSIEWKTENKTSDEASSLVFTEKISRMAPFLGVLTRGSNTIIATSWKIIQAVKSEQSEHQCCLTLYNHLMLSTSKNQYIYDYYPKQTKKKQTLNDHPKMSLSSSCEISPLSKKQIQEPKSSAVTDEHMHNYIWILMCEGKCACKNKECESERASERRERVMMGDDAGLCWGLKGTRHEVILVSQRTWACMVRGDWWSVGYIRKASI